MERLTRKSKSINSYVLKDPSAIGCMSAVDKLGNYEDLEDRLHGISIKQVVDEFIKTVENQTHEGYENGRILTNEDADRWNEYKNAEEQGMLLRLPCKAGDTVYAIGFDNKPVIYESVVLNILIAEKEIIFNVKVDEFGINSQLKQSMFGKTVFLTKVEAEQKLKEMERD